MKEKYIKPEIYTETLITEYLQAQQNCCAEQNYFEPEGGMDDPEDEFCKICTCIETGPSI